MLPPVEIDGARHVDGGVLDVLPWRRAAAAGTGEILVLDCRSARPWESAGDGHALGVLLESFALARHHHAYDGIGDEPRIRIVPGAPISRGHTLRDAPALVDASLDATRLWIANGGLDPQPVVEPPRATSRWSTFRNR
jgi:predicted acylesterase/phospholipase RssA